MPTADSFTALGRGNGFPYCIPTRDVSTYDYWTTLSGWSKSSEPSGDSAKAQSIAESLGLAMQYFWNTHQLNCNAAITGAAGISSVQVDYDVYDYNVTYPDPPILIDSGVATPMIRSCIPSSFGGIVRSFDSSETDGSENAGLFVNGITAMYDGETFVGYGLGFVETRFQSGGTIKAEAGGGSALTAGVYVGGYGYTQDNTGTDVFDIGYVTFGDMEVFAYVEAKNRGTLPSGTTITGSVNLNNLYATCKYVGTSPPSTSTATAEVTSLDFYTY